MPYPVPPTHLHFVARKGKVLAGAAVFAGLSWLSGWAQGGPEIEKLRVRAEQADVEAQNALGSAYTEGKAGVKTDYTEALKWFRRAAERNYAPALYNLGLAFELGHGVTADERQAFRYYLAAAEQGFAAAQYNVGNMFATGRGVGQDLFESNLWLKQAAEKGVLEAQFNLGLAYEAGRGVKKDETQAARWYKQAADRGFPRAQYNLGLLLEDGRGVAKSEAAAANYYRAAAEHGFAAAQNNYGLMIAEGRGGLTRDPIQAWVWLSLAAENGGNAAARDFAARQLTPEQRATAEQALATRRGGQAEVTPTAPLSASAQGPAAAPTAPASGGNPELVDQLRAQNQRLAAQVEALAGEREAARREAAVLAGQVKDLQQDLAGQRAALPAVGSPDAARHESQVPELTAKLQQATAMLAKVEAANQQLTEVNARLQQEKDAPAKATPSGTVDAATVVATLQKDNARLNDEVKRSTRELLSLNSQLRALRNQVAVKPAAAGDAPAGDVTALNEKITQLTARLEQAGSDTSQARQENARLTARLAELANQSKPAPDPRAANAVAEAQKLADRLQQQVTALQSEKTELEKWSRSLEQTLNEKSALAESVGGTVTELRQQVERLQKQLEGALAENQSLAARATVKPDATELEQSRAQTAAARQQAEQLSRANQALTEKAAADHRDLVQAQAHVASLERDSRAAEKSADHAGEIADLKTQLSASNQRLEQMTAHGDELKARASRLESDLATAQKDAARAAEFQAQNEQLKREGEQLATAAQSARVELAAGQARVSELEQTLAATVMQRAEAEDARKLRAELTEVTAQAGKANAAVAELTGTKERLEKDLAAAQARTADLEQRLAATAIPAVRARDDDDALRKLRADLAESNAAVEKLNATVAELTGTNDRLEKDLENSRKSAAAALAAQSQAVSAAQPDAYRMEIGTLQTRVKELEGQIEEERNNSAKEVSTLAAQLARTRDTNRSLSEANRALLTAKQAEAPTVDKAEFDQLQARVRELNTAVKDANRENERLARENEGFAAERTTLQQQLEAARKTASVAPGLADEKAALQEKLESTGAQLVKAQQEIDLLQKDNAELVSRSVASKELAEKAQADLAALQGKAADVEKAADNQNSAVAELTGANAKLEEERSELRRQLAAARAENTRLAQSAGNLEQLKADADRSAQQNIAALSAQLAQTQRDLQSARETNSRIMEGNTAQERDRLAVIGQLRAENTALAARLVQAQGTLDQIASAARLGTPAASIAAGGAAPARSSTPVAAAAEARIHTVTEGDSLSRISMRYYGTANRWQEIYNANREVLQNSSTLRVGMQLRIP